MSSTSAMRRSAARWLPTGALLALLGILVILPLGMLLYTAVLDNVPRPGAVRGNFTTEHFRSLASSSMLTATRNSLIVGLGGTALALTFGAALAWLGARTDVPGRWLVQLAGIVPLFVSSLVGALAWVLLLAPRTGYINIVLEGVGIPSPFNAYSLATMVFIFGMYYAPYAFLFIYGALSLMNPDLEEAARVHGASDRRTLRRITFPLVKPAVLSSALLIFALVIENFPVPTILGSPSGIHTLPSYIYLLMNSAPPRANQAAAIGMLLLLTLMLVIFIQRKILAQREYTTVTGKGIKPRRVALGSWRWPAFGFCLMYIVLAVMLPFAALIMASVRQNPFIGDIIDLADFSSFSFETFSDVINYSSFQVGIKNSLLLGVLAAAVGGLLHTFMAFAVHRSKAPGRQLIDYIAVAPVAVPAIVFGMGFLWTWFMLPIPIYGTLMILVLAYVVIFMPQSYGAIASSLRQIHPDLEESAQVCGANKVRAGAKITLPLVRSGLVSALLLIIILTMRELSVAIFLVTADTRVLSITIFDFWDSGLLNRAAAASVLYSLVLAAIALVARRYLSAKAV